MSSKFSLRRLGYLLRNDLRRNLRSVVLVGAVFVGLGLIGNFLLPNIASLRDNYYFVWFAVVLFVWGPFANSRAFRDMHDKTTIAAYLLLPASALEKTLARLLGLTIGFVVVALLLTVLFELLAEAINALLARPHNGFFHPLESRVWEATGQYLAMQGYFFLGAAWFRRAPLTKTSLVVIAAYLLLAATAFLCIRLLFGAEFEAGTDLAGPLFRFAGGAFVDTVLWLAMLVYFVAVPALCWYTAYLRVREAQVSDGV